MFRPLVMQRVALQVLREDAPHAALVLAQSGVFDPEPSGRVDEHLPEGERSLAAAGVEVELARQALEDLEEGARSEPG